MVNDKHFLHLVGEAEVMKAEILQHDVELDKQQIHLENISDDLRRLQIKADRIESSLDEHFKTVNSKIDQIQNIIEYLVKRITEKS
jgi:peptidoglycan hydrolase CwlO-like protein